MNNMKIIKRIISFPFAIVGLALFGGMQLMAAISYFVGLDDLAEKMDSISSVPLDNILDWAD
jgi:hypothetical protein